MQEDDLHPLAYRWLEVCDSAANNFEVATPFPRKWGPIRIRELKKIDAYLDGDWAPLIEAVRTATTWGAPCRLDLSLERLTSKDCERLDSLLSGKWRREENQKPSEESKLKEQEDGIIARIDASTKAYGRYSDSLDDELRQVRRKLAAVRGRAGV